jgi:hypothetical protein
MIIMIVLCLVEFYRPSVKKCNDFNPASIKLIYWRWVWVWCIYYMISMIPVIIVQSKGFNGT